MGDTPHWDPEYRDGPGFYLIFQGGGIAGAAHIGNLETILPEIEKVGGHLTGASGVSAGALAVMALADAVHHGDPTKAPATLNRLYRHASKLYDRQMNFMMHNLQEVTKAVSRTPKNVLDLYANPFNYVNPFSAAAGLAKIFQGACPDTVHTPLIEEPLSILERVIRRVIPDERTLNPPDFQAQVTSTRFDASGRPEAIDHTGEDFTIRALLASAALREIAPTGVSLGDRIHYDGGYSVNPALPAHLPEGTRHVIIYALNQPIPDGPDFQSQASIREEIRDPFHIMQGEMHAEIDLLKTKHPDVYVHVVQTDFPFELRAHHKLDASPRMFQICKDSGRTSAQKWLNAEGQYVLREEEPPEPSPSSSPLYQAA